MTSKPDAPPRKTRWFLIGASGFDVTACLMQSGPKIVCCHDPLGPIGGGGEIIAIPLAGRPTILIVWAVPFPPSGAMLPNRSLSALSPEPVSPLASGSVEPAVRVVVSRWLILLLVVAILPPWLVIALLWASGHVALESAKPSADVSKAGQDDVSTWPVTSSAGPVPQQWIAARKGPWGAMDTMIFSIDLPDEFVFLPTADTPPIRWSFPGYSKEKVLKTLRSVGMPEADVKALGGGKWDSEGGVAVVEPGDRLILGLPPEVRSKLYAILVAFPQNARQIDPIWFRPGLVDWRLEDSGMAPESIALLKGLLYHQGEGMCLFADFEPALRHLPNDAQRKRFLKAISRKRAVPRG